MVLNGDSTHPKPWRPPGIPEALNRYYQPYAIHQKFPTVYTPLPNWLEDEPFTNNMYYAAKKGVPIGMALSALDITNYSKIPDTAGRVARVAYITLPITSVFMSYVALRHLSSNIMERSGKKKNSYWTYAAAALGPSAVMACWQNITGRQAWGIWAVGYVGGCLHQDARKIGYNLTGLSYNEEDNPYREENRRRHLNPTSPQDGWWGSSFFNKHASDPEWKKWEKD
jgi:hypothetical protein